MKGASEIVIYILSISILVMAEVSTKCNTSQKYSEKISSLRITVTVLGLKVHVKPGANYFVSCALISSSVK